MTEPAAKSQKSRNPVLTSLSQTHAVFRDCQPLAIGIHKALKTAHPELSEGAIRFALKIHTASTKYLKAVASGNRRYDLDANPVGEISAEQKQQANETLKERFRLMAERKRTEQLEKEKQEKLQRLAEKFSRR